MPEQSDFNFSFINMEGQQQHIPLSKGSTLFVLGANGTGKSALMQYLFALNQGNAKRISAHRQTWFSSNAMDFTSATKVSTETSINKFDRRSGSRWSDDYPYQRTQVTVFDLINAQNIRARKIAEAMDSKDVERAELLAQKDAPLTILNRLLKASNLPIEISIAENERVFASKKGSNKYSIAELSDGERNAILIAADVLTADENTLFIIDEPERHLHRSIISPLLISLFQQRPDCTFVVATHEINLPLDNPNADVLLVRGCKWPERNVVNWDTNLLSSADEIDHKIKHDILGSRRILLFVEGDESSLDLNIYQILFPEISIIPRGSCSEVEKAVYGISSTGTLDWVKAIGLIDSDDRSPEDIDKLKSNNVFSLPGYSVESIYYCSEILEKVADKCANLHGDKSSDLIQAAYAAVINAAKENRDNLCARLCERKVKQQILIPDWKTIRDQPEFSSTIDLSDSLDKEKARFDSFVSKSDAKSIIRRYPIHKTPALSEIAKSMHFSHHKDYERAVRQLLVEDLDLNNLVRSNFSDLVEAIEQDINPTEQNSQAEEV
jgi:ABC-type cobalamin/Fe3+-siderophores transport system ATPase subunit